MGATAVTSTQLIVGAWALIFMLAVLAGWISAASDPLNTIDRTIDL